MHAIGFGPRLTVNRRGRPLAALFDFARAALPAGATLTRASAGSRYDAGGVLVSAGPDVARFDYAAGQLRGLLIEPAASNALCYSTDWTNGYWTRTNLGGTASALIETSGTSAAHLVRQAAGGVDYTAGQIATASVIAAERAGSAKRYLLVSIGSTPVFAGSALAIFDLATGTVTAAQNIATAGTEALGGGAWLCWLNVTPVATSTAPVAPAFKLNSSATVSDAYAGDGSSGLDVRHVQIEPGGSATSRIVTTSAAGTRAADRLVLDWRALGVPDGTIGVRYGFDDGTTQDVTTLVAGGTATVPTNLARRRILRAQKL